MRRYQVHDDICGAMADCSNRAEAARVAALHARGHRLTGDSTPVLFHDRMAQRGRPDGWYFQGVDGPYPASMRVRQ